MKLVVVIFFSLLKVVILQNEYATARQILWRKLSPHYRSYSDYKHIDLPKLQNIGQAPNNLRYITTDNGYFFSFAEFGAGRSEIGELRNRGQNNEILTTRGQYYNIFVTSEGAVATVHIGYVADEYGYQPFLMDINVEAPFPQGQGMGSPGAPKGTGIGSGSIASAIGQLG